MLMRVLDCPLIPGELPNGGFGVEIYRGPYRDRIEFPVLPFDPILVTHLVLEYGTATVTQ